MAREVRSPRKRKRRKNLEIFFFPREKRKSQANKAVRAKKAFRQKSIWRNQAQVAREVRSPRKRKRRRYLKKFSLRR